jgi:ubiquinone/menaquinone biosynthesis C-methylase UbiE
VSIGERVRKRQTEKMSNTSFKMMTLIFKVVDFFYPHIEKRLRKFNIKEGMTIVDYGCGPGRYTMKLAELTGETGKVYAVDIHELAIAAVRRKIDNYRLNNIEPLLIEGYDSTLPAHIADVVCVIDMFWIIKQPTEFLEELSRITKKDGTLIIDDGHQSRDTTRRKILASPVWDIVEETRDHLKCRPR